MKKTPSSKPTKPPDHVTSAQFGINLQRSSQTSSKQTTIAHEDIIIKRNPFNWTIVEKDFCTKRFPNTTILVVLHTAIEHYERRQIYRDMYGEQLYEQVRFIILF
ncbi:unnamed protein product [Toxocara canis]|uniref:Autophagy-related protein n=1 Tax=Toxocara canis TaxID=6265 RepID=A0A183U447_TOXCA|nr:unnamed protein product [Toxocara canis]